MATKIIIVDPQESTRTLHGQILKRFGCWCAMAADAKEATARIEDHEFELALVDLELPGVSGLEMVRFLRSEQPSIAPVMIASVDDPLIADAALEVGAYGYLTKPVRPNELLINVSNALRRRTLELENRTQRERLEQLVSEKATSLDMTVQQLRQAEAALLTAHEETIVRLARAAEFRDDEGAMHIQRMSRYCELLAKGIGSDANRCELIRLASVLHDVGKIAIPDDILLKQGPLTPYEFEVLKRHTEFGHRILTGSKAELLQLADTIAWTHHERYDGSGYPCGVAGDDIPVEGRIAAIADVFDAITRKRVYKSAMPLDEAITVMRNGRAKHFDPALLDLFLGSMREVEQISQRYVG
jgi:putative two-component system response regulator